jgi:hypothetical protein
LPVDNARFNFCGICLTFAARELLLRIFEDPEPFKSIAPNEVEQVSNSASVSLKSNDESGAQSNARI